jgi:hypothetical protein
MKQAFLSERSRVTGALVAAAISLGGCVVSPQPLPPIAPSIDLSRVSVSTTDTVIQIHGDPGAVTSDATLSALSATTNGQPAEVVVAKDGSFDVSLEADPANLYRMEAELDGIFSAPIDLSVPLALDAQRAPATVAKAPFASCLVVDTGSVVDVGSVRVGDTLPFAVQLQNGCSEDVVADDIHLRFGDAGFVVDTAAPLTIPAGQLRAVSLRFVPTATTASEDLAVIHVTGSEQGFLLVTVRGEGTP